MKPFREAFPNIATNPPKIGRPRKDNPKQSGTIRPDPEVVEHFRAGGKAWQSRINETLRKALKLDRRAS